jgi:hypothetical protein
MLIYLKGLLDDNFKLEVYMHAASYTLASIKSGKLFLMEIIKLVNTNTYVTVGCLRESSPCFQACWLQNSTMTSMTLTNISTIKLMH